MPKSVQSGFTLIELMIVIAVIGILAAIAIPNYQDYLVKTRRTAAQASMMDIANRQQQFLLANRAYADQATLIASGFSLPAELEGRYTWTVNVDAAPSYTITFTATGPQVSDGNLSLNSQGVKTPPNKW